jgi:hypothetical protein
VGFVENSPPTEALDDQTDPLQMLRARNLRRLEEMIEVGMAVGRDTARVSAARAEMDIAAPGLAETFDGPAIGLGLARVYRTVRQCMLLQERLLDQHDAREAELLAQRLARAAARADRIAGRKREVSLALYTQIDRPERAASEVERLEGDMGELMDALAEDDIDSRPIGALVASLCQALGLTPDWRLHQDTAWMADEVCERPAGSPYAQRGWHKPPEAPAAAAEPAAPSAPGALVGMTLAAAGQSRRDTS